MALEIVKQAGVVVHTPEVAAIVGTGTAAMGLAEYLDYIRDTVGAIAVLVGLLLTTALLVHRIVMIRRSLIDLDVAEIDKMEREEAYGRRHGDCDQENKAD